MEVNEHRLSLKPHILLMFIKKLFYIKTLHFSMKALQLYLIKFTYKPKKNAIKPL